MDARWGESGSGDDMKYDEIDQLRTHHPAWALLRSNNSALVLSFLGREFVDRNVGDIAGSDLASELDEELYALKQRLGEDRFPKSALAYLDDWASPDHGWLRKFYPPGSDEPRYDVVPAVEKAVRWVGELRTREFIGTESRLNTIFELLRQMVFGADEDPDSRLVELRRRRAELDSEIARAERGEVVVLDSVSQRDRYQQFSRTARELLSDFREVEENFRRLDRSLRHQIAGWTGSKGALLDEALGSRNSIAESDQGRSFQTFYDFLLSHQRQAELTDLLERVQAIREIDDQDERLAHIHFDWIDASERTQSTVRLLSEQLRRFLDDQVWLENRRVFDLLRNLEAKALKVRDVRDPSVTMELPATGISVSLPTERPLYRRPTVTAIDSGEVRDGSDDFDSSALLSQMYIDRDDLLRRVWDRLGPRTQVGLCEVLAGAPLEQGLAELVGYLSLIEPGLAVVFDEQHREQIGWSADEVERVAELPRVNFSRDRTEMR
jgi:Protein of unknown function (DUF3375)